MTPPAFQEGGAFTRRLPQSFFLGKLGAGRLGGSRMVTCLPARREALPM